MINQKEVKDGDFHWYNRIKCNSMRIKLREIKETLPQTLRKEQRMFEQVVQFSQ
jgi:hypothetical protein